MTTSTANLLSIAADLTAAGKEVSIRRLPTRKMRKGEGMSRNSQHGAGRAMGSLGDADTCAGGASHAVGAGKGLTITRVTGLGSQMVADLDATRARAAAQHAADRRAAARERLMDRIDAALSI